MKLNTKYEEVRAISTKWNAKEGFNNEENLKFIIIIIQMTMDDYMPMSSYRMLSIWSLNSSLES